MSKSNNKIRRDFKTKSNRQNRRTTKRLNTKTNRRGYRQPNELSVINNAPVQTRCLRYIGDIDAEVSFVYSDFTRMLVAVTSGSTQVISLFEAVKIQRVGVTVLPNSAASAGTFSFTWSGDKSPHTIHTMLYSQGVPARWSFYPPEDSLAYFWINQDTTGIDTATVFSMADSTGNVRIVLDIQFEYVLANGASATSTMTFVPTTTGISAPRMPVGVGDFDAVDLEVAILS
jgi:hypothetical protein